MTATRMARSAVPIEQTWDLDRLYQDVAAWEADVARFDAMLPELLAFKGRLGEGPGQVLGCLRCEEAIGQIIDRVYFYAYNRAAEDQGDPARQSLADRALAAYSRLRAAASFIRPELLALPEGTLERYLAAEPELEHYRLVLTDILDLKPHTLGAEAEAVVAQMTELLQTPYTVFSSTTQADIRFEPVVDEKGETVPMSLAALGKLLQSPDRGVREAAYASARRAYEAHKRTLAATFAAAQKRDAILARIRRYPSSLAAALAPGHLPESLFHNLLQTGEAGSEHFRRYLRYRRQALGLEQLMPWDLSVPLDAEVEPTIGYDEAWELILAALAPLGPEYRAILQEARQQRWVDWADNAGKRVGAYSSACYGYHPVILMTWQGTLADAFTLIHELGHSVHSVLSARHQPFTYADYSLFLAEMASTTNELLLARHLLSTTSDRTLRRYVLTRALSAFQGNFWGGCMGSALMLRVHEMAERGEPLTYESVTAANVEILRRWYGDTVVVTPEDAGSQWLRVLHHYRNFYYYQYATGISAAAAFSAAILAEGEPAVQRYLRFLSAGSSAHDLDLLKAAGLDMTTPAPIERAIATYAELVDELERT